MNSQQASAIADERRGAAANEERRRLRAAIIDDDSSARQRLLRLLARHADLEVIAVGEGARAAVDTLRGTVADLVILDVRLRELDGFDVIAQLAHIPAVIFTTAFAEHAVRAFEVSAVDYLLKPVEQPRFDLALARVRARLSTRGRAQDPRFVMVRATGRAELVRPADIDWITAAGNYVEIRVGPQTHLHRATMTQLQQLLGSDQFLRVHRHTIVNVDRIASLDCRPGRAGMIRLVTGERRRVGRRYLPAVQARLRTLAV